MSRNPFVRLMGVKSDRGLSERIGRLPDDERKEYVTKQYQRRTRDQGSAAAGCLILMPTLFTPVGILTLVNYSYNACQVRAAMNDRQVLEGYAREVGLELRDETRIPNHLRGMAWKCVTKVACAGLEDVAGLGFAATVAGVESVVCGAVFVVEAVANLLE